MLFIFHKEKFLCFRHSPIDHRGRGSWEHSFQDGNLSCNVLSNQRKAERFRVLFNVRTATEMIPTIEMIFSTEMTANHYRNDPHHRNDTGGHHRNDRRNIGNGIKRTTKTGQQFSACFLFICIASFLRCVIYLLPHFILQNFFFLV